MSGWAVAGNFCAGFRALVLKMKLKEAPQSALGGSGGFRNVFLLTSLLPLQEALSTIPPSKFTVLPNLQ